MGSNKGKKKRSKSHKPVTAVRCTVKVKKSAELISKLHQLNKEKQSAANATDLSKRANVKKIKELQKEVNAIGGLDGYQHLSKSAESRHGNFNSAKWVLQQIETLGFKPSEEEQPLQLLDVGALDLNYKEKAVECTAIDLNPQKKGIVKADFLKFKESEREVYDVVVLSLVLNFAGDMGSRGDMLRAARRLCKVNGHVVIVLPLACLDNSRYLDHALLEDMMTSLGLDLATSHNSPKLSFKMFVRTDRPPDRKNFPKKVLRTGHRNNFAIILKW